MKSRARAAESGLARLVALCLGRRGGSAGEGGPGRGPASMRVGTRRACRVRGVAGAERPHWLEQGHPVGEHMRALEEGAERPRTRQPGAGAWVLV